MTDKTFQEPGYDVTAFRDHYLSCLRKHSATLIEEIRNLLQRSDVSPDVTSCEIQVFPDEYGDGSIEICMYFDGRNRLVRKDDLSLYCGAVYRFAEYVDDLPSFYVDLVEDDEPVRITVRCVIAWFSECWKAAGGEGYRLPVTIVGHEYFATPEEVHLSYGKNS